MLSWRGSTRILSAILLVSVIAGCSQTGRYPVARKVDQIDDYNGVKVADRYRWMEDLDAPELKKWIDDENKITFGYLGQIPERARIKDRLTKLWNYEKYQPPFKEGGKYFISKNDGLQNQNVIYTMT